MKEAEDRYAQSLAEYGPIINCETTLKEVKVKLQKLVAKHKQVANDRRFINELNVTTRRL